MIIVSRGINMVHIRWGWIVMHRIAVGEMREIVFSFFAEKCFAKVRLCIDQQIGYSCVQWMECVASLHYLKNVFRIKEEDLIQELNARKPYLSDEEANIRAISIVEEIKVGA
ncbi:MAG: hypothetical protein K1W22_03240 [Lachnospiraceae bacterium]